MILDYKHLFHISLSYKSYKLLPKIFYYFI